MGVVDSVDYNAEHWQCNTGLDSQVGEVLAVLLAGEKHSDLCGIRTELNGDHFHWVTGKNWNKARKIRGHECGKVDQAEKYEGTNPRTHPHLAHDRQFAKRRIHFSSPRTIYCFLKDDSMLTVIYRACRRTVIAIGLAVQ